MAFFLSCVRPSFRISFNRFISLSEFDIDFANKCKLTGLNGTKFDCFMDSLNCINHLRC